MSKAKATKAGAVTAPAAPPQRAPLWPQPIPVIGVSGEPWTGKTLFMLSVAPRAGETRVYDFEKSSETYGGSIPFDRVDVYREMLAAHPDGYKPADLWEWWLAHVKAIPAGRYRVIGLDTVTPIEDALCDWVMDNAPAFGKTKRQYQDKFGHPAPLFWGDVKSAWQTTLNDIAARCECFIFTAHMGTVYAGNQPTMKRKAKGKATLFQLASLYLELERKPDAKGERPGPPSAVVKKERLPSIRIDPETGELDIRPYFPPRLPVATPAKIRHYMLNPPDFSRLKPEELAPEEQVSDDERAEVRMRTAAAVAEAERLRAEREARHQKPAKKQAPAPAPADPPAPAVDSTADTVTHEQLDTLADLRGQLFEADGVAEEDRAGVWADILAKRGVTSATQLTAESAQKLIAALQWRLSADQMEEALEGGADEGEDEAEGEEGVPFRE